MRANTKLGAAVMTAGMTTLVTAAETAGRSLSSTTFVLAMAGGAMTALGTAALVIDWAMGRDHAADGIEDD